MKTLFENYPELLSVRSEIELAIDLITECYESNGKILLCGNGGSASDCSHIVGELMKSFMADRKCSENGLDSKICDGVPAIDLTSNAALITAISNDVDPDLIFAQQVYAYSKKSRNDVLFALSTSGNSKNVVKAVETAKKLGLKTVSLTGSKESKLSKISTVTIKAPAEETFRIQEYHLPIYHYICQEVEKKI